MKIKERIDSFSSDDELPLTSLSENGAEESNSYEALCRTSVESCEFCDKVFKNRYKSLVHNASHIIIPLINQSVIKCKLCLYYFTSSTEYEKHALIKHSLNNGNGSIQTDEKNEPPIKLRNRLKFEDEDCLNLPDLLKFNHIQQPFETDGKDTIVIVSDDDGEVLNSKFIIGELPNRIDLCNSSFEAVCNDQSDCVSVNGACESYVSVRCDVLKRPKRVRCRHCDKRFPDRYSLIVHEASHMDADRRLPHLCTTCDWYIAGGAADVKRHRRTHSHNNGKPTYKPVKHCSQCGLGYRSLVRHANNYHRSWREEEKYEKIIHVCDLCYEFLRSRTDRCYAKQGTLSEVGKRYTCHQCTRTFFDLNIVRTRLVLHNWGAERKIKKKLTNKQRLDKIQNRLLQMNKLGKL